MDLSRSHARLVVAFLIGIALVRVMGTYRTVGQTSDEPSHLAAGMEWLDAGRFDYEPKHPPLPRVTAALGPYGLHIGQLGNWRIPHDAYGWVESYEPVARVGKTIRLYRFPADPDSALRRSH